MEEMGQVKYERAAALQKAREEQRKQEEGNRKKFTDQRQEATNRIA